MNSSAATGYRTPFTALQWQELEQQALIFKYMISGMPVPPELLLPIRKSMESLRFFHHPTMGYCSFYGKKVDPEPGRCRRTDGKKWRCSKDAYPDSKYCERHMHRGRNRSRKPVENHNISQSSSSLTSLNAAGSSSTVSYQNLPLNSMGVSQSSITNSSQIQTETNSYEITGKEYRCYPGLKPDVGEHSFFSEASGSVKGLGLESSMESSWNLMPSKINFFSPTRQRNGFMFEGNFSHLQAMQQDVDQPNFGSAISRQPRHCYLGGEYPSDEPPKEVQSLRPFFDEWPKARDSWSDLDDERSNRSSFSTTQLSMSIPMASSDFSATSSRSPTDD